ncbi:family 1 glycosylhydrolase [Asanoa sp. NPDC049518]|uniref:family 1 glycosylhydrolase n=1 Tax=unclassified Asanoa TaxID=2685164 RepID=UPI00342D8338
MRPARDVIAHCFPPDFIWGAATAAHQVEGIDDHAGKRTGLPLFVSENGIGTTEDRERVDYLDGHLTAVATSGRLAALREPSTT